MKRSRVKGGMVELQVTRRERPYTQPAFLICAGILAVSGIGLSVLEAGLGVYIRKEPVPLRRPLDRIDESALAPFHVVSRLRIDNPDVLRSLGTSDYIQWVFEDTRAGGTDPARSVLVFITYYGLPDRVPHVPEECYLGGGFECLGTDEVLLTPDGPQGSRKWLARYLTFGSNRADPLTGGPVPVLYLFRVNGHYAASREEVRLALNRNLLGRHSYFSKVELVFNRHPGAPPDRDQVVRVGQQLLGVLLPVLERDHWPQEWTGR